METEFEQVPVADCPCLSGNEAELTDEEVGFFRDTASVDFYNGTVAMSRLIARNYTELGTRELHTSTILAREMGKTLGGDAVRILLFDRTNDERKWVSWEEFAQTRKSLGEENVETHGVFGILEGDDPQGSTIYIRGDMDALPTHDGKAKHMCGHNVHTSWLKMNCEILQAYKERFGALPFRRVVFIGEVNEEGMASPIFGPVEMVKAGLFEITGKPDIVVGSHLVACQPEGTLAIEEGAALAAEGRFNIRLVPAENYNGPDLEIVKNEIEYQITSEMESEVPRTSFGTLRLVEDTAKELPRVLVRIADSKTASQESWLQASVLKDEYSFSATIDGDLQMVETPEGQKREDELLIEETIDRVKSDWTKLGVPVEYKIKPSRDNQIEFIIRTRPGHVASGGPNVEYFGSAVIHALYEKYGGQIRSGAPIEPKEIAGSISIKTADWRAQGENQARTIREIIDEVLAKMGADGVEMELSWSIDTPPVINDDNLRNMALEVAQKAGIEISSAGLPNMAAESFSYWQELSGAPGIYLAIGGADRKLFEETLKSKNSIPESMMHHNPKFTYQESAIPYGAITAALAIKFGKAVKKT